MRTKYFMITVNNPTEQTELDFQNLGNNSQKCEYLIYQKEMGEKKTKHIQAYFVAKNRLRFSGVKKFFSQSIHIEARKGSHSQAKAYCSKEETRLDKTTFTEFGDDSKIPKKKGERQDLMKIKEELDSTNDWQKVEQNHFSAFTKYHRYFRDYFGRVKEKKESIRRRARYESVELRDWQEAMMSRLDQQNDRNVLWLYEHEGGVGKSWLANYLEVMRGAFLIQNAKRNDIAHAYNYEKIVVFDLTRSDKEFVNYSTIEQFKNGRIFSGKYESKMKRFIPAKVLVLANYQPDKDKLSLDRWDIVDLSKFIKDLEKKKSKK